MESLITNLDLFILLRSESTSFDHEVLFGAVVSRLGDCLTVEDRVTLKEFCRRFTRSALQRWKKSNRFIDNFKKHYGDWLESNIDWPSCVQNLVREEMRVDEIPTAHPASPRPSTSSGIMTTSTGTMTKRSRKPFQDLGKKQKKRRSDEHVHEDSDELAYAAAIRLKEEGREDVAAVIEYMLKNPRAAFEINKTLKKPANTAVFTPEKALGLLLSLKLSKWQYITLRESAIREGAKHIYPSYYRLQQTKLDCYPPKESITVTDASARITLQAILDITVKRILQNITGDVQNKHLKLVSKWGFDGASSQSRYKQKMEQNEQDDSSIFMTSLVPLKLTDGENILWTNPKPCSTWYCRPVSFIFVKESEAVVIDQKQQMDVQIKALVSTECSNGNQVIHQLRMTMIDAKVCTYLSEARSNASCYLCLAKPTQMNHLDAVTSRIVSSNTYEFGLSSLHARINCMECLLHISYRLDFKEWAARSNQHKEMLQSRKKNIQDKFKDELNILIDIVKQGSGTTNDGNTARKFFEFPDKTAAITGLDEEIVRRFAVILQAITSGEKIDIIKFKDYARKTAEKYVELYDWYYMSSTVHKLLIHGADIIEKNNIVPIGSLSEEASEARNKEFRRFREHHSRKRSRQDSNQDILNVLLLTSDPLLSAQRPKLDAKKKKLFFPETLDLIQFQQLQDTEFEFLNVSNLDSDSELESDESDKEN